MVSKRKTLGKTPLIFVTVGTTQFRCVRFFELIDKALGLYKNDVRLIVQAGATEYCWTHDNCQILKTMEPKQMVSIISEANRIITHAGFGTLYTIFHHQGINPFVIPRQKQFREHVDDHQKYFLNFLREKVHLPASQWFVTHPTEYDILSYISANADVGKGCFDTVFSRKPPTALIEHLTNYVLQE